jgi:hypothetical protein
MKVIIAGSRGITDMALVELAIQQSGFEITEVVCGEARGVDKLGRKWAEKNDIPVKSFPADWERHYGSAGHIRNAQMVRYADAIIIIWDGRSPGTRHVMGVAMRKKGMKIHLVHLGKMDELKEALGRKQDAD